MDELRKYVDGLFKRQNTTPAIMDLKEEIYSNMVAKRNDLIKQGLSDNEATQKAKDNLSSIDGLIEGNQLTFIKRYYTDCRLSVFMYSIIAWILSMPLMFSGAFAYSFLFLIITVILGIFYFANKQEDNDEVAFISITQAKWRRRIVWIVWTIFYVICAISMTLITFGSNIWFGRPISISGPYQFATIAMRYYIPLLTIFVPVAVSSSLVILSKYEKRDNNG